MSRIFDALRRSKQSNGYKTANSETAGSRRRQYVQTSFESQQVELERIEHVVCHPSPEQHVLVLGANQEDNAEQEQFRVLYHRLNQMRQQQRLCKLLVTSAIPQEGKTLIALNLAATLARYSPRVLLVDADLRRPSMPRALGLGPLPGLADVLEGRIELTAAYRRVDPLGFYHLGAGQACSNPAELLQKQEIEGPLSQMTGAFDWIVVDSPPLTPFADAHHLATLADGVLLVVRQGLTPREAAKEALGALGGVFVAGVVLNACTDPVRDYYFSSYSDEGRARSTREENRTLARREAVSAENSPLPRLSE